LNPNFTLPVDNTEDDYEENCEPSPELLRLVEQEAKEMKPIKRRWKLSIWGKRAK